MEIKLKKITLNNFKGIGRLELDINCKNIAILGNNGTGKTTIADSMAWLLYNQDSQGNSINPKPLNLSGYAVLGICSEVEAIFEIDGKPLILKKSFSEKRTKRHGATKKEFEGHVTKHYFNEVPVKKGEYEDRLNAICSEQTIKLLTNINYFTDKMHWRDRRRLLLDICGDINDADIITSNKKLTDILQILADKTFDERKKIIVAQKKKLNTELNELPVRIDEVNKGLPDMTDISIDIADAQKKHKIISKALSAANEKKVRIETGGEIAKKTKQLHALEADLLELQNKEQEIEYQAIATQKTKQAEIDSAIESETRKKQSIENKIKENSQKIEIAQKAIIKLRDSWTSENKKIFDDNELTCPTCEQQYPIGQAQKIKETFNTNKAKILTDINATGKILTQETVDYENQFLITDIAVIDRTIETMIAKFETKQIKNDLPKIPTKNIQIEKNVNKIKMEIEGLKSNNQEAIKIVEAEIKEITKKMDVINQTKSLIKIYTQGKERIGILMNQQRVCASELEMLEGQLFTLDEFIKTKVSLLEKKINLRFVLAKFKLFNILVNGSLGECCEVACDGVPYNAGLNTGAKLNVGIDCINNLGRFFKLTMPVFIDNAESVIKTINSDSQLIKLTVDANYNKLTIQENLNENKRSG